MRTGGLVKIKVKYGMDDPEVHEMDLKDVNIVCNDGKRDVHILENGEHRVVVIQSPGTLSHFDEVTELHWAFWAFWEYVRDPGGVDDLPDTLAEIKRGGMGFKHLAGLIDLFCIYTFDESNIVVHIRHPETHLHPRVQCALGDMQLAMAFPWRTLIFHLTNGRKPLLAFPKKYLAD